MNILAIDPGPVESAWVLYDSTLVASCKEPNEELLSRVCGRHNGARPGKLRWRDEEYPTEACVIEKIASYGMSVGEQVFETVYWSGRFAEAYGGDKLIRVPRLTVKLHHCHDSRAKDANIRQAIIDRFGGKERAIGRKSSPGPLYGVSGDVWAALAVALWYADGGAKLMK